MRESDKQMLADHYLDLYQMAYSLLHNKADVEDAVQDALVDTMSNPFVVNPYNYCKRVLKNNCLKRLKKENYILFEQLPEIPNHESEIDEELPNRIQEIFDLYYVQGYSRHQISEITNTPMPTLKKLFHKGHERLKKMMLEYDQNNIFFKKNKDT